MWLIDEGHGDVWKDGIPLKRPGETKIAPINVSSKRARDRTYIMSISVEKKTNVAMCSSPRVDREPFKLPPFEHFDRAILAPESD